VVRIPVIPGVNDSAVDIDEFVRFLDGARIRRVDLLPYHGTGAGKYRRLGMPYALDHLEPARNGWAGSFLAAFAKAGVDARIGG
jgi:pyruvate formate lyase activating enzyme